MFKSLGVPEIILILVIIMIFFGVGKLPQVGESIGKAIRSFKKAQSGDDEEEKTATTTKSSTEKNNKKTATKKA
ncbi:MAG TPA: twin-arginine translocase TatA/TatE family subunit [Dehalococcoidales bacterium]